MSARLVANRGAAKSAQVQEKSASQKRKDRAADEAAEQARLAAQRALSFTCQRPGRYSWDVPHEEAVDHGDRALRKGVEHFGEVAAMATKDPQLAMQVIARALNSPGWRTEGWPIEEGFSLALAEAAVSGVLGERIRNEKLAGRVARTPLAAPSKVGRKLPPRPEHPQDSLSFVSLRKGVGLTVWDVDPPSGELLYSQAAEVGEAAAREWLAFAQSHKNDEHTFIVMNVVGLQHIALGMQKGSEGPDSETLKRGYTVGFFGTITRFVLEALFAVSVEAPGEPS